jgi:hypothetical protein
MSGPNSMRLRSGSTSSFDSTSRIVCIERTVSSWYWRVPKLFHAISLSSSSRTTRAGAPITMLRGGIIMPALTKLIAAMIESSPTTAWSITTEFMPTMALRPTRQPCSTAPWPMWPSTSITVSSPGKPCITQVSCRLAPSSRISRPKSPRSAASGPT